MALFKRDDTNIKTLGYFETLILKGMEKGLMIRVLHIFHEMANGGVEHFVMDYYRHINREEVQFDFLVSVEEKGYFDDEIKELGGKIFHATPMKKGIYKNYQSIAQIVKENDYKIVHRHTGSAFGYFDLRAARCGGAEKLILHSHNNQAGNTLIHWFSKIFLRIPCEKLACSQEAGEWLFGKNTSFKIINNAIDCKKFQFKESDREKIRKELCIEDSFVIGHVGRFENQKNHIYLLNILKEILKENPKAVLICVGIGSLSEKFWNEASNMEISQNIKMLGTRKDVNILMQAFDVFVLPSLYEGFPFVLVEAQSSGLESVVSNNVPQECNVTGNIEFLELTDGKVWAEKIIEKGNIQHDRSRFAMYMSNRGYDINKNAINLCQYYKNLIENKNRR